MGRVWVWLALRILIVVALALTIYLAWNRAPPWAMIAFAAFVLVLMAWKLSSADGLRDRRSNRAEKLGKVRDPSNFDVTGMRRRDEAVGAELPSVERYLGAVPGAHDITLETVRLVPSSKTEPAGPGLRPVSIIESEDTHHVRIDPEAPEQPVRAVRPTAS